MNAYRRKRLTSKDIEVELNPFYDVTFKNVFAVEENKNVIIHF